jgi:hypothetical protein
MSQKRGLGAGKKHKGADCSLWFLNRESPIKLGFSSCLNPLRVQVEQVGPSRLSSIPGVLAPLQASKTQHSGIEVRMSQGCMSEVSRPPASIETSKSDGLQAGPRTLLCSYCACTVESRSCFSELFLYVTSIYSCKFLLLNFMRVAVLFLSLIIRDLTILV